MPLKSNPSVDGSEAICPETPEPERVFASIGFTPAATMRTSSSLITGEGTGTDAARSASGPPGASNTIACIEVGGAVTVTRSSVAGADRSGRNLIGRYFRGASSPPALVAGGEDSQ